MGEMSVQDMLKLSPYIQHLVLTMKPSFMKKNCKFISYLYNVNFPLQPTFMVVKKTIRDERVSF